MFEAATWRTSNRRHFDILEEVYRQVDRPLQTLEWDVSDHAEYAAGFVHHVGSMLLSTSISVGLAKNEKEVSNRKHAKAWRAVNPEAGCRASVFLTLAVASILSPEIDGKELDRDSISNAQRLIEGVFSLPQEDLDWIERTRAQVIKTLNDDLTREAVERGGLADQMAIQSGQAALSFRAMEIAGVDVDRLPAFEAVRGVPTDLWEEIAGFDWLLTFSIRYGVIWRNARETFVDMAYRRSEGTVTLTELEEKYLSEDERT